MKGRATTAETAFPGIICGRIFASSGEPWMESDSSAELLIRVRGGDREALDALLRRYVPALRRWARGRLPRWARETAETEDLVQDTVMRTFQRLETFEYRGEGALQAYLRQAVLNRIKDECRRTSRRPLPGELDPNAKANGMSPLDAAIGKEAVAKYEAALAALPDDQREAVVARVEMGFSYQEIAVMLGKPSPDAARVAVSRALVRLAGAMRNGR
jgi:RNA polymerase sigma-70 factor (ECF subfamily)